MEHDKIQRNLSAYKDCELDKDSRDEISRHLQVCDSCRRELRELDQIDSLVQRLPQIVVSETFASEILARAHSVKTGGNLRISRESLPRRILERFLDLADSVFELLPGYGFQRTATLEEFGDFPPLSLSHAYLQLIGKEDQNDCRICHV